MLTEEQLAEWEQLANEATPGPYNIGLPGGPAGPFWSAMNQMGNVVACQITSAENAAFLQASREAVPALIAEVRRLREVSVVALMKVRALKDEVERLAPYLKPTDARSSGASKHPL